MRSGAAQMEKSIRLHFVWIGHDIPCVETGSASDFIRASMMAARCRLPREVSQMNSPIPPPPQDSFSRPENQHYKNIIMDNNSGKLCSAVADGASQDAKNEAIAPNAKMEWTFHSSARLPNDDSGEQ